MELSFSSSFLAKGNKLLNALFVV